MRVDRFGRGRYRCYEVMSVREWFVTPDVSRSANRFRAWSEREYLSTADDYANRDQTVWSNPTGTARALHELVLDCRPFRVLELGAGTGRYFPFLRGQKYIGVDICSAMLRHARARSGILKEHGFSEVTVVEDEVMRFLELPEHHGAFDFVFSIGCVGYHVPVNRRLMQQIHTVLTPGGRLFLQTTQQSVWRRARAWSRHGLDWLLGRQSDYNFFVSTTERRLRRLAHATQFDTEWVREDTRRFFGQPILLSSYRKPS